MEFGQVRLVSIPTGRHLSADRCDLNSLEYEKVTTYCEAVLLTKPTIDTQGHKPHVRRLASYGIISLPMPSSCCCWVDHPQFKVLD